ncbi:MAG: hypothetical protein ABI678_31165 [Kofleriaceae bacterium]
MRARARATTFLVLAACGHPAPPPPVPAAPIPVENLTRTCGEAAVGIEQATRGIRSPDSSPGAEMKARCVDDHWSSAAIECFAQMKEGDLGTCAGKLPDDARRAMFAALGGTDETAVAIAKLRLASMRVGVEACDQLFATAHAFLDCDQIPLETRAQVGPQIAESWNLPDKLPPDAQARMATVCSSSRETLLQQAVAVGCQLPP